MPRSHHRPILLTALFVAATFLQAAAPSLRAADDAPQNPFPNAPPAPSLAGGVKWLNCAGPISLRDLRGKIVLIDFWTYCCINCMHMLPFLHSLEEKYDRELVVIGVHSGKFDNEQNSEAIREAILRYDITHPVVNDANMTIWRRYNAHYWPTFVLIDPEGNYCGARGGEGPLTKRTIDAAIQRLIAYHSAKGTLNRTPIDFALERESVKPTPLRYPGKVLADADSNRLFISDNNHNRIVVTTLDGELVDVIGSGEVGRADGDFDTAQFNHPQGMALANGILYVADTENHLIRAIDLEEKTVSTLAGTGKEAGFGVTGGPLLSTPITSPWDLLIHRGILYIAMAGCHQIWWHKLGSDAIGVFAGTSREDINDGPHKSCAFAQPSGLATDGRALFVCDSEGSAIRRVPFNKNQPVTTVAGTYDLPNGSSLFEFGDRDGTGSQVRLQHPLGATYYKNHLYIADSYNHKIKQLVMLPAGVGRVTTLFGQGAPGDGLDPLELAEPGGLAATGNTLYVADTNNHRIVTIDFLSGKASRLKIEGLTPPDIDRPDGPKLQPAPAITAASQTIQPGKSLPVSIQLNLPVGYKLNKLYPVVAQVTGTGALVGDAEDPESLPVEISESTITINVPLTGNAAKETLEVFVRYGYCRHGQGGLCMVNSLRWRVPVSVAAGGAKGVQLTAPEEESDEAPSLGPLAPLSER